MNKPYRRRFPLSRKGKLARPNCTLPNINADHRFPICENGWFRLTDSGNPFRFNDSRALGPGKQMLDYLHSQIPHLVLENPDEAKCWIRVDEDNNEVVISIRNGIRKQQERISPKLQAYFNRNQIKAQ